MGMVYSSEKGGVEFTFIELFAGIGGFRIGLEAIGGKCVWACELDQKARLVYNANFGQTPYYDITKVDPKTLPEFDLLIAGFPCQDFSTLGEQDGLEGTKGKLFYEILRIIRECKPSLCLLENVKGLLTMAEGSVFKKCVSFLQEEGYSVVDLLLNSSCMVFKSIHFLTLIRYRFLKWVVYLRLS